MATAEPGHLPNIHPPDVMRGILEQILATGDVIGSDDPGRTVLAVTVDNWLLNERAALGTELEDCGPEPIKGDDDPVRALPRHAIA